MAAGSAGMVATSVRSEAAAVMREPGIEVWGRELKPLDCFLGEPFDAVITPCDDTNDACPVVPRAGHRWRWLIADPSRVDGLDAERLAAFRQARDELDGRIGGELISALLASSPLHT